MIADILKITAFVLLMAILTAVFSFMITGLIPRLFTGAGDDAYTASVNERRTLIIDPGHGGEDPGAIGVGGVLEKELNLALSKRLAALLEFEGHTVVMTREDDVLLYGQDKPGSKKGQDLKNRLDYENKYQDGVFISIHMNKFPAQYCKGVQIYYSDNNDGSRVLAENVMQSVVGYIQPDNHRQIKAADSSIYILKNIKIPALLIECGFISNNEEASLLQKGDYQDLLSAVFAYSLNDSFSNQ